MFLKRIAKMGSSKYNIADLKRRKNYEEERKGKEKRKTEKEKAPVPETFDCAGHHNAIGNYGRILCD